MVDIKEARTAFENTFGQDQSRTPQQWRNMVKQYGMDMVKITEKMTEDEVKRRMNESFGVYYKRMLKNKRANVRV